MPSQEEYLFRYAKALALQKQQLSRNTTQLATLPKLDIGFFLVINNAELIAELEAYMGVQNMYRAVIESARERFLPQVLPILGEIFIDAADIQDRDAFPPEYLDPILEAVYRIPVDGTILGNAPQEVVFTLPNLEDHLGGFDDYEAAFHHGALKGEEMESGRFRQVKIKTGKFTFTTPRVNVRTETVGEDGLFQQRATLRYKYWKLVMSGAKEYSTLNPLTGEPMSIPVYGSREDTVGARLEAWHRVKPTGAPQWQLLEYGQARWNPKIKIDSGVTTSVSVRGLPTSSLVNIGEGQNLVLNARTPTDIFIIPRNITGKWVQALSMEWTAAVTEAWSQQILFMNRRVTPPAAITRTGLVSPSGGRIPVKKNVVQVIRGDTVLYYNYAEIIQRTLGKYFRFGESYVEKSNLKFKKF